MLAKSRATKRKPRVCNLPVFFGLITFFLSCLFFCLFCGEVFVVYIDFLVLFLFCFLCVCDFCKYSACPVKDYSRVCLMTSFSLICFPHCLLMRIILPLFL